MCWDKVPLKQIRFQIEMCKLEVGILKLDNSSKTSIYKKSVIAWITVSSRFQSLGIKQTVDFKVSVRL